MNLRGVILLTQTSLTGGTTYNLACCAAPSNQEIALTGFGYFGYYNAAGTPGKLTFNYASNQGSSGTALTPAPLIQQDTTTFRSSWISYPSAGPSITTQLDERAINPQLGLTELWSERDWIVVKAGGFFIVQFIPQQTVNYGGWLRILE